MEDINVLELDDFIIKKIEFCSVDQFNDDVELFAEDMIIQKNIKSNKMEVLLRRSVGFEPEYMFNMSVDVLINFDKIKTVRRSLKQFSNEKIIEEIIDNVYPVLTRVSMIISSVTSQALGLPLVTSPYFIKEKTIL